MAAHVYAGDRFARWLAAPQHFLRVEIVRVFAPLAILGFMASRIAHADEWLGQAGFRVPDLGVSDPRQPMYLGALPNGLAWAMASLLVASGLTLAAGFRARTSALVFACVAAFVALSDRLAAFSVSKLAPVVGLALAASTCGARLSVDAWLARRRGAELPSRTPSGAVRFFQLLLPTIYCASGIAKARGDWLIHPYVMWTHLHDTYQTWVTVALANALPPPVWTLLQMLTLGFEVFAPAWFAWRRARGLALAWAVAMHAMIALMFGPVRWFAMLMITLVSAAYLPDRVLDRIAARLPRNV